jgi:hypothetical protein
MTDRQFPATYSADVIEAVPPESWLFEFHQSGTRSAEPLLVALSPHHGSPWIGAFARGYDEDVSETGVWPTPDDSRLAVVAAGAGYYVDVHDPTRWHEVPIFPIRIVVTLLARQLLVFGDFARLAAYNSSGLKWATSDFAWDDLEIISVGEHAIIASGYDAEHDRRVEVSIDVDSGDVAGGVRPPPG